MSNFQHILKQLRLKHGLTQDELSEKLGISKSAVSMYENGNREPDFKTQEAIANLFGVDLNFLHGNTGTVSLSPALSQSVRINVLGSVPAGVPIEAITDIVDWEEIPFEWTRGGQEYIALRVKGDSMYPKYLEGDTIIVLLQPDCESGQDAIVYVDGYEATLKKVIKEIDHLILQPLNPNYTPKMYEYNNPDKPVRVLGTVAEIRRRV